jgi:NAD(P)H-dependent FMN reductase
MITVINATNREGNLSQLFSKHIFNELNKSGIKSNYYSLEDLPQNFAFSELYGKRTVEFSQVIEKIIIPSDKVIFVVPEYNGSYAGILKVFLEAISPKIWNHKKAAVVGIASGRGGNLIGIDQLVTVLNYLQVNVMPQRLPISRIEDLLVNGKIEDNSTLNLLNQFTERFVNF